MNDYLIHHGILGQKWGIRRYQNEDGSLTPEGKQRYGVSSLPNNVSRKELRALENAQKERIRTSKEVLTKRVDSEDTIKAIKSLNDSANKIVEEANALGDQAARKFREAHITSEDIATVKSWIKKDIVSIDNVDDKEFLDILIEEYAENLLRGKAFGEGSSYTNFFEHITSWRKQYEGLISKVAGEFENLEISKEDIPNGRGFGKTGQAFVENLLDKKVSSHLIGHMWRHFDDYWVDDTDDHYNAVIRLSKEIKKELGINNG